MKIKINILALLFLLISSCNSKESIYKLLIRSPYECTHFFEFNKKGAINYKVGLDNNSKSEFKNFQELFNSKNIIINKREEKRVDSIIKSIKFFKGKYVKDAFHYQLYVDENLLIDSYGNQSKSIDEIRSIIEKSYPKKIDYHCDEFYKD